MRRAMYEAEVGDDVYREDPTTTRLEEMAAKLTGKERALFVTSGSMGNLIAQYINGGKANEVLCASNAHILQHEVGGGAAIAGVVQIGIPCRKGILSSLDLEGKVKQGMYDMATTTLIEVENTIGGYVYPLENLRGIQEFAQKHKMKVHMDGARVFNAQVATHTPVKTIASYVDTLSFCLSKGLGCPVGSLLCSDEAFYQRALTIRKMIGGGMRQTGILAAAGIYALTHNIDRLKDDHDRAKQIAQAISCNPDLVAQDVETNIIFFSARIAKTTSLVFQLKQMGILASIEGEFVRLVTNLDIDEEDTQRICSLLKDFKVKAD